MDKQKADQIITEYIQKLYGFAIKKTYSYDEAEDLCAEIIKEVYSSLLNAREVINVEGYIWRISEYTYAKYVSYKKKHEGITIDGMEIPFYDDYTLTDSNDELRRLRREIAFLTEKRRQIVFRFYYEDKSISVIAKEMNIPEGTVKWHLNKARNELKEGFSMERKIGKLGLSPVTALNFGHSGDPGSNGGPEFYLGDKLNLNVVYSVYHQPRTAEEIAEELGMTPVFLQDRIDFLEGNGFLVRTSGGRYTTYVNFTAGEYSREQNEIKLKLQLQIAEMLVKEYIPAVRKAVGDVTDIYIPGGKRELLEAAAIFYAILQKCEIPIQKDLSNYMIKTTAGGEFIATVDIECTPSDPDYKSERQWPDYTVCGSMWRESCKYRSVSSWSADSRYDSREGYWTNNLYTDYEYLYEYMKGLLGEIPAADSAANSSMNSPNTAVNPASAEKFARLRKRGFLTEDGRVNIMVIKGSPENFFARIPVLNDEIKARFANKALEFAMLSARRYPPQMQDLIIAWGVGGFISSTIALMVMDILYGEGMFKPLTEQERVTANLLMFSDTLPE